ncbi:MAG: glycosyltransferase [Vulcanimicrobiota bacterium]
MLSHQRPNLLWECLLSLSMQTFPHQSMEIIVVDDGPIPETTEVVERFDRGTEIAVRYCPQLHQGISAARNRGVQEAGGEFVAIVADDYLLPPEYAEHAVDYLCQPGASEVVRFAIDAAGEDFGSRVSHLYYDVSLRRRLMEPSNALGRLAGLLFGHESCGVYRGVTYDLEAAGGAIMSRGIFQTVGLFNENLARAEDTEFTQRLRERGMSVFFDGSLSIYHQYRKNMTDTFRKCFETGRSRRHLAKFSPRKRRFAQLHWITSMLDTFLRNGNARTALEALLAFPFLVAFELANKLGYLSALLEEYKHFGSSKKCLANQNARKARKELSE